MADHLHAGRDAGLLTHLFIADPVFVERARRWEADSSALVPCAILFTITLWPVTAGILLWDRITRGRSTE